MKVACAQLNIAWENREANFERLALMLSSHLPPAGSLLVLPEMAMTGFSMDAKRLTEHPAGPTFLFYSKIAAACGIYLIGGLTARDAAGPARNEAVVIGPSGKELARYCKIHPFSLIDEADHYAAGSRLVLFPWAGLLVCPLICYDLRFPEIFRQAVARGAGMFVIIANWPTRRVEHWTMLLRARAIENQAYVVGVNRCGSDPGNDYPGRTMVIDPQGRIINEANAEMDLLVTEIDPPAVGAWRSQFPAVQDMRGPVTVESVSCIP